MKNSLQFILLISTLIVSFGTVQAASIDLSGYAWSSNVGWVNFDPPFGGVSYDDVTGNFSGYAWSSNIGWLQFGGLNSFPTGAGTVASNARLVSNDIVGWMRALGGTSVDNIFTEEFSVPSSGTWTVPSGVIGNIVVKLWGAGAGGNSSCLGGSGGSGGYGEYTFLAVPGVTYSYTVGSGGAGKEGFDNGSGAGPPVSTGSTVALAGGNSIFHTDYIAYGGLPPSSSGVGGSGGDFSPNLLNGQRGADGVSGNNTYGGKPVGWVGNPIRNPLQYIPGGGGAAGTDDGTYACDGRSGEQGAHGRVSITYYKASSSDGRVFSGWDGWISLKGSTYSVTKNGNNFGGYSWGSTVIGWLDWDPDCGSFATTSCGVSALVTTPPLTGSTCIVTPEIAVQGQTVTWTANPTGGNGTYSYAWSGTDSLSGTTASVQKIYSSNGVKTGQVQITSGSQVLSATCQTLSGGSSVTIQNSGTTACSDGLDNDGDGLVDLSDTACADLSGTSEASVAPVVDLKIRKQGIGQYGEGPYFGATGDSIQLQWTVTGGATSCVASGNWSGSQATSSGVAIIAMDQSKTFSLTCSNASGSMTDSVRAIIFSIKEF